MKRILTLILTLTMLCLSSGALAETTGAQTCSLRFDETLHINWMTAETNFDLVDDIDTLQWIRENMNVDIHMMGVPNSDYYTKLSSMLSDGSLPDVFLGDHNVLDAVVNAGLLLNISDYAEYMPDYLALVEDPVRADGAHSYLRNGSYWGFQQVYYYRMNIAPLVDIREDLLTKLGIETPRTWDQLYDAMLKIRDETGNYVFSTRNGITYLVGTVAYGMGGGGYGVLQSNNAVYFDPDTNSWRYGPATEGWKRSMQYITNAYADELLHPDYNLMDRSAQTSYLTSDQLYVVIDNTTFTSAYNDALREIVPDGYFNALAPLQYDENIPARTFTYNDNVDQFAFINAAYERKEDIVKFFNWLYTDEGRLLTNYGIEGKSYYITEDGRPCLTDEASAINDIAIIRGTYGIGQFYIAQWVDQYTNIDMLEYASRVSGETSINLILAKNIQEMKENGSLISARAAFPIFTAEETEKLTALETNLDTVLKQNIDKFITGERSMDEWDAFVQNELAPLGIEEVEQIYNQAEARSHT